MLYTIFLYSVYYRIDCQNNDLIYRLFYQKFLNYTKSLSEKN